MTIDPTAAISTVTEEVAKPAADPALSTGPAAPQQNVTQTDDTDVSVKAGLFDQASQQQLDQPPAIETLASESKAKYLSNPQVLGEQVLQRLETLHQRSVDYHSQMSQSAPASASNAGGEVMAGPASGQVAGTNGVQAGSGNTMNSLNLMFNYAVETTMISTSSSQFVSGVNTLMKGQ